MDNNGDNRDQTGQNVRKTSDRSGKDGSVLKKTGTGSNSSVRRNTSTGSNSSARRNTVNGSNSTVRRDEANRSNSTVRRDGTNRSSSSVRRDAATGKTSSVRRTTGTTGNSSASGNTGSLRDSSTSRNTGSLRDSSVQKSTDTVRSRTTAGNAAAGKSAGTRRSLENDRASGTGRRPESGRNTDALRTGNSRNNDRPGPQRHGVNPMNHRGTLFVILLAILIALIGFILFRVHKSSSADTAAQSTETTSQSSVVAASSTGTADAAVQDTPVGIQAIVCETEDGSGNAGQMSLENDYRGQDALTPGWHSNDPGIWYSIGEGFCYYNGWCEIDGQQYHFDMNGYATRGWAMIGGQSCYFDDNGVYTPGQDNSKLVAFTFDDGPSQGVDELMELCDQTGARVTFFMIGAQVDEGGAVIPSIVRHRCELGNHSNTHTDMIKVTPDEAKTNFEDCDALIASYNMGVGSTVIRFPYGDFYTDTLATVNRSAIMWDIDTLDWSTRNTDMIMAEVRDNITEGDIILMHDRYEESIEACRTLFPELIAEGYQLVTVSELAAAKGITLEPGVAYYNFRNDAIEAGTYCSTEGTRQ